MTELRIEQDSNIATLTIEREDAGNSLSNELITALDEFFIENKRNLELRAVIITGAGERFFAAGGDVKRYRALRTREQLRTAFERPRKLMEAIELFHAPVIAAINGWSLGGGSELMLACDLRIIDETARIGFPYAKLSLVAGWDGAQRLVNAVGESAARNLLLRAQAIDAQEALRINLVHEIAKKGEVLAHARKVAMEFMQLAPLSAAANKRILHAIANSTPAHARQVSDQEFEELWLSDDHREAEAAFEEKRPTQFRGQ